MSETFTKVIEAQEKEIASLNEKVDLLNEKVASLGKTLDSRPSVIDMDTLLDENESLIRDVLSKAKEIESLQGMVMAEVEPTPCKIHGVKECANIKCLPTEVDEA